RRISVRSLPLAGDGRRYPMLSINERAANQGLQNVLRNNFVSILGQVPIKLIPNIAYFLTKAKFIAHYNTLNAQSAREVLHKFINFCEVQGGQLKPHTQIVISYF